MPKRDVASKQSPYQAVLPQADITALDKYVTALAAAGGPPIPDVDPTAGDAARGMQLYMENCAACHGAGGSGGILFDRPVPKVTGATPTQVGEAIRVGPAEMPVFGAHQVSPAEVNDIAAYVQSLKRPADRGGNALSHLGPVAEGLIVWLVTMAGLVLIIRWIGERG
jgi:ubiquinol-cytochrome c reductase cytochrome c subunit